MTPEQVAALKLALVQVRLVKEQAAALAVQAEAADQQLYALLISNGPTARDGQRQSPPPTPARRHYGDPAKEAGDGKQATRKPG